MIARRQARPGRHLAALAVAMIAATGSAYAGATDGAPDAALKAAFIYNFAKFTEWPALPADAAIVVCVVGDDRIAAAFVDIALGQHINAHALEMLKPRDSSTWRGCHVLFIADAETRQFAAAQGAVRTLPVLTVSDGKGFSTAGGIIEFFTAGGKVRFAINLDAAELAGLRLSSRLLGLAQIVRNGRVD